MARIERVLALLSTVLILGGAMALYPAYFPRWDNMPKTPTRIWAGPMDKIERSDALAILYLPTHVMRVDYTIKPKQTAVYHLDIWTPYKIGPWATAQTPYGTNVTKPIITHLGDGTYWVSVNASLEAYIETAIDVQLQVQDIYSAHEPGKDTVVITFWGGILTDEAARLSNDRARVNSTEIFDHVKRFLVIVQFPNDTILSSDTFPPPTSVYITGNSKWAAWLLNFTSPLPNYGQGIVVSMFSPERLKDRDISFFLGGLLSATGAGGAFESVRDHFRDRRRAKKSNWTGGMGCRP